MRIGDIMTAASCVRFDESARETLEKMRTVGAEYAIITRDTHIVGVVSRGELATATADNPSLTNGEVATPVPPLPPDAELKDAANVMRSRGVSCVPVTEGSTISGIVTTDRLLELIGRGTVRPRVKRARPALKDRTPKRKPFSGAVIHIPRPKTRKSK